MAESAGDKGEIDDGGSDDATPRDTPGEGDTSDRKKKKKDKKDKKDKKKKDKKEKERSRSKSKKSSKSNKKEEEKEDGKSQKSQKSQKSVEQEGGYKEYSLKQERNALKSAYKSNKQREYDVISSVSKRGRSGRSKSKNK